MDAYLLDTNIVITGFAEKAPNHKAVLSRLERLRGTGSTIMLPVITIAEIEFGLARLADNSEETVSSDQSASIAQDPLKIREFLSNYPLHLPIDDDTVEPYSLIRAEIFRVHGAPKRDGRSAKKKLPEELLDRVTGKSLGIDERDLLIASVAVQHNMVLVTNDRAEGMRRIHEAADTLCAQGKKTELRVESWS